MIKPLKPCSARCTGWIVARQLGISFVAACPRCWAGETLRPDPAYYYRSKQPPMNIKDIEIGMRVHADDCAPEDADQGYVTAINYDTGMVEVVWDTLQSSDQLAAGLKPGPLPHA